MNLHDDMLKHRIFLQRLSGTQEDVIQSMLKKLLDTAKLEAIAGTRGNALTQSLRSSIEPLQSLAVDSLTDIATYESKFVSKLLNKHFDSNAVPLDAEILNKKLISQNMAINNIKNINGKLALDKSAAKRSISTAYKQYGQRKADELVQVIRDSETKGLGLSETVNSLTSLSRGLQTAQAAVLATTSVNYAANVGKMETLLDNPETVERVQWSSALDSNTCGECESLDGEIFSIDEAPDWPYHWNCACDLIPV